MHFKLLTPEYIVFDEDVVSVSLPGAMGRFQVLDRHAALVSALHAGTLQCKTKSKTWRFNISKGIAEVQSNQLQVLVDTATTADGSST